jgi:hypothetical protein
MANKPFEGRRLRKQPVQLRDERRLAALLGWVRKVG